MDFASWTESGRDIVRVRRLAMGYGVGTAVVVLVGTFISLTAAGGPKGDSEEEDVRDVQLATAPEEPLPEPEPEPEPAPEPVARPKLPKLAVPVAVPHDKPAEAEPTDNGADSSSDPYMNGAASEGASAEKAVVEVPKPPPSPPPPSKVKPRPEPAKPVRVTENMSQPQCVIAGATYPDNAKAAGIEGTVIVRFVVTETGEIKGVKAVRGPEELRAACVAAVKAARCTPAMLDGVPVTVFQSRPFRFRLKT